MASKFDWLADVAEALRPGARAALPATMPDSPNEAWQVAERAAGASEAQLAKAAAEHFSIPVARLDGASTELLRTLPYALALRHRVLVTGRDGERLQLATCNPDDKDTLEELRFVAGQSLAPVVQGPAAIESAVLRLYGEAAQREAKATVDLDAPPATEADADPVVRLARQLLRRAAERRASDLHLQPYMGGYLVRIRVDGTLARLSSLTHEVGVHVVRHFKATAGMDVTDAARPQDGRGTVYLGERRYDLRLSSVPNAQGERLVIRLLNQARVFSLEKLGYAPARAQALQRLTRLDSGLVLFVGPTGCGKTTSLYALVSSLNSMQRSIATIEQPVEYVLPGLSQVEVRPERGTTFASVLRAQLRQDPDVLLLGEIRDEETAEAATRAALTGHLVFSTLHSSAARYAVPRLLNLGVSAPMIGETLQAVVSQRLVRRLCAACATPATEPWTAAETLFHDITRERPRFRAVGCEQCGFAGFKGVMPVVEFYFPSNSDRLSLMSGDPSPEIWDRDTPVHEGDGPDHRPLAMRVLDLVVSGVTTPEEAVQVMGQGWWSALARHYKHVGWFDGSTTDAALFSRSEAESELLVSGAGRELVAALGAELADAGYRVIDVDPDVEPAKLLARHPNVGLLLLDLEGDDSKSSHMLRRLRQSFAWTGIPAVVLVPPEAPGLRQALEQRAANYVVPKPASAARIAEVIRSLSWGES